MNSKFKNIIKDAMPNMVLAFAASFMLFFYEPIIMYGNNINDLWFDIGILIKPVMAIFLASFITISVLLTLLNLFFKKVIKKPSIFYTIFIIANILFITTYIEGNYLSGMLPPLDGTKILWNDYTKASVISAAILIIVTILTIILTRKVKFAKTISIMKYLDLAIIAMLLVSFATTTLTTDTYKEKENVVTATATNLDTYSSNENFIIFLLDAVDSKMFNKALTSNKKYKDFLSDFTYYPDTMGVYPFTRDSIPFILSGVWNNNENNIHDYYVNALDNSPLLKKLEEKKYDINIYDSEIMYDNNNAAKRVNNLFFSKQYKFKNFIKNELKYISFKYLPFYLKQYSSIEKMNFNESKEEVQDIFDERDTTFYNEYLNRDLKLTNNNQFKFIHIEGAHVPFDLDEDVNLISNGTYEQKLVTCFNITNKYLEQLKKLGIYDNANIIIMSDHGYSFIGPEGRQNPILYIKTKNDKHNKTVESSKKISYDDLQGAYEDILNGANTKTLFSDISNDRDRRYLFYIYNQEDHMIEYNQKGHAWDNDTMIPTGKEFNR